MVCVNIENRLKVIHNKLCVFVFAKMKAQASLLTALLEMFK